MKPAVCVARYLQQQSLSLKSDEGTNISHQSQTKECQDHHQKPAPTLMFHVPDQITVTLV